ncbi:GlxA family transcriptional regulator [Zhouia amylolytica]|uniref:HTH araC/xylS-type domain-containing protein n=1 Tax=Zhouia amylolytica AD3 TaxID=1286632 RepID=W2UMU3_9FLAO|nr:DJ-1/PfpI family protein [Zhouia amylolytica]ETN94672.1 hypothetical protein P278_26150 [Zhouia amylolytica AD3]
MQTVYFYITNQVHLLDLSGVLQVFQEAKELGFDYGLEFISDRPVINSSAGLKLNSLVHYSVTQPGEKDFVFIPGFNTEQSDTLIDGAPFYEWLRNVNNHGATICSICTGAFLLAKSGLLDHKMCTTHWRYIDLLKTKFPFVKVKNNKLFVQSGNIFTSAGVATGIDLALFLIEESHGKLNAIKIAKELAVYIRRNGTDEQESVFLQFRDHQDQKVHIVQDWIIHNLEKTSTLESLAEIVHTSPRNLSRIFKKHTGVTIAEYRTKLRVEKATSLVENSGYKLDYIARLCGYKTSRQLREVLNKSSL